MFGLNSENRKNVGQLWVIMVMFEEPDRRILFLQPVSESDEKELQDI